ncbi:hypothetical protein CONCODRAFT_78777 [Conidiobolus coronatus NRRL 28638]|uniref:Sorting nexin n=1 Tax=Conidiobolus coronatus (strain ATCC 28846 / CBS 209.66 / NRRL 28638) TaxID=796925 RepID=A0A137P6Q2_CONC2|nr:hypothetical protein CONCODRAFT_78777 [Conidiobolus coronatus NRRL 28638]|eukprot:KXN70601.1 hypothetical protein CONCODRAFT_78777 [Conidiobolus coronatus NRRL 28638]
MSNNSNSNKNSPVTNSLSLPKSAKILYDFTAQEGYEELSVKEGESITVLENEPVEGWCLVENSKGDKGLVPVSYILFDEHSSPSTAEHTLPNSASSANTLSRTGSVFGRRQLNRFSWFVTTGVEEFILGMNDESESTESATQLAPTQTSDTSPSTASNSNEFQANDVDRHFITHGPNWQEKTSVFTVYVHDPETRTQSEGLGEYTIFYVSSIFSEGTQVTVERRFSQFEWLYERLHLKFRSLVLPHLPEKQFSGRFSEDFIEKRRNQLERFINHLAMHPVIRYSEIFTHFLSCTSDVEWSKADKKFLTERHQHGLTFFQHVYHPEFNVEDEGDEDTVKRFNNHIKSIDKLLPMCYEGAIGYRDHSFESSDQYRKFSYGLLRMISGLGRETRDCVNDENVWCFKDNCDECLRLTKGIQLMAESMQEISDIQDSYAKKECQSLLDRLKEYHSLVHSYSPIVEMHGGALAKYKEASNEESWADSPNKDIDIEKVKSRCDTVFNVTLAEINQFHQYKLNDFKTVSTDFLDDQIEYHQKILNRLMETRQKLEGESYEQLSSSPRAPPKYNYQEPAHPSTRPASVVSMSGMVGGVVDTVGSVGSFFKNRARNSMFGDWVGWGSNPAVKKPVEDALTHTN